MSTKTLYEYLNHREAVLVANDEEKMRREPMRCDESGYILGYFVPMTI